MSYASPLNVYVLSHSIGNAVVTDMLNGRPEVLNWFAVLPGTILIVSRSDLTALAGLLHATWPWFFFLLNHVQPRGVNGYMNQEVWEFINNPRSSGRWE